jgi:PAS domain S-box-containing protein
MTPAKILIVEDERVVARDIQGHLTALGYSVVGICSAGGEAVRLAEELRPDLVLMDIRLEEGSDGVEAALEIRNRCQVPVVYMTAYADEDTLRRACITEPFGYILKPFEERELRTVIEIALHKHAAERKLRRSQQRYETLVNSIDGIVWEADARTLQFTFVSRQAERLRGYPLERWFTEPTFFRDHIHPDDRDQVVGGARAAIEEKRDQDFTYRMLGVDGREVWLHNRMKVVVENEHVSWVRGVMVDVTQQKRLEAQFHHAQKMEAVGRLAGGVAHDFNNLLTAITGYSEMVLDNLPPRDVSRGLTQEILQAGERAARLTQQLLAFSRKQVLRPTVLNLNRIISGVEKMLGRLIGEDVELVTRLDPHLGLVKADLGQLEQVIVNLAVNARDAMPSGGQFLLETANVDRESEAPCDPEVPPGRSVRLTVSDTGCGMDEATRARLFEPFFTTKEVGKGTGLGLSTVYGIIKQSGGHITVSSSVGHGTTFTIYLPRVEAVVPDKAPDPGKSSPRGGQEVVLVVEDEAVVRRLASVVLRQQGYTVLEATDGVEALRICERYQGPLDLLLTDLVMPQMNGRQLARALKRMRPELKVLYFSGYPDDAILRHGFVEEGLDFFPKPFTSNALAHKVREVLDRCTTD